MIGRCIQGCQGADDGVLLTTEGAEIGGGGGQNTIQTMFNDGRALDSRCGENDGGGVPEKGMLAPTGRGLGVWVPVGTGGPAEGWWLTPDGDLGSGFRLRWGRRGWGYGLDRLICWEYS